MNSCEKHQGESVFLFEYIDPSHSNVSFENTITPDEKLNLLTYEYLYNGGGVGLADFNNDGLPDMVFTGSQVKSKIYVNKGDFQFDDITAQSGLDQDLRWATGVSVIDINQDGWQDIYICAGGPGNEDKYPNQLYINNKDLTFSESAAKYGLNDPGESIQAVFFDYDLDGDLDMYLCTGGGFENSAITARPVRIKGESRNTDRLYKNIGNSEKFYYQNVSAEAGISIEGFGLGVNIIDANNDQWPDIYISNDYLSRDLLYINNQDSTFTEKSLEYFNHISHFSMGNDVGDINNDGLADIITVDMLPEDHIRKVLMSGPNQYDRYVMAVERGYGHQHMRNMLHLNHGMNGFSEVGQLYNIDKTDWSWAPLIADFDLDGWQDLYVTNGYGQDITDLDYINYRDNAISSFAKKEEIEKIMVNSLKDRPVVELPNYIFRNTSEGSFEKVNDRWLLNRKSISNGASYADLDLDGDLDIMVNNINSKAFLIRNNALKNDSLKGYLKIELKGDENNLNAIGAKVSMYSGGKIQVRYNQPVHGFLSSSQGPLHFGTGTVKMIDSLKVDWPNGHISSFNQLETNKTHSLSYSGGTRNVVPGSGKEGSFKEISELIDYKHNDPEYPDFKYHPLLIYGYSRLGPKISTVDLNKDGVDDFFIGGAYQENGMLFISNGIKGYQKSILESKGHEDLGSAFFDLENDGDLDLYVTSGGVEVNRRAFYQDRIYINDGNGNFKLDEKALPEIISSTGIVLPGDFDRDGDQDLFVGGRVDFLNYPQSPVSYLLRNDEGVLKIEKNALSGIESLGMVTSALWVDVNNDHWMDLVIAGEFMPIRIFGNEKGQFKDITNETGLSEYPGWWNTIVPIDIDNDGDLDFIGGNLGMNHDYNIDKGTPLTLSFADFDENGKVDAIFSSYDDGKLFPRYSLDLFASQIPSLKKKYTRYYDYATQDTEKILSGFGVDYKELKINYSASAIIKNKGNSTFELIALPVECQFGPINDAVVYDLNGDGYQDVILVGNNYNTEVVGGRYDALTGVVLLNDQKGYFEPYSSYETNFYYRGDAREIEVIKRSGANDIILIGLNGEKLKVFEISRESEILNSELPPE